MDLNFKHVEPDFAQTPILLGDQTFVLVPGCADSMLDALASYLGK